MGYVEAIKAFEHGRLADAAQTVRTLRAGCDPVIRQLVNVYLDTFPPFPFKDRVADEIAEQVIEVVQEVCDQVLESIAALDELVDWIGGPEALRAAAAALETTVNAPVAQLSLDIDGAALPALSSWVDLPPSEVYRDVRGAQVDELNRLPQLITSLRTVLRGMADAIEQFYVELGIAITGALVAVGSLVLAVLEAAGVITIPLAVVSIVTAIIGAVGAVGGIIALVVTTTQVQGNLLDTARTGFTRTWANRDKFATVQ
ncbi:hypothetical protein ACFUMH_16065 [Cellulomonas sp. NPDC057328]|uniref:hypothetical protein n=1 Tax=Cellulomonas sp. NPDC057328 TaxID=3346101 RepID=UPI0036402DAF